MASSIYKDLNCLIALCWLNEWSFNKITVNWGKGSRQKWRPAQDAAVSFRAEAESWAGRAQLFASVCGFSLSDLTRNGAYPVSVWDGESGGSEESNRCFWLALCEKGERQGAITGRVNPHLTKEILKQMQKAGEHRASLARLPRISFQIQAQQEE